MKNDPLNCKVLVTPTSFGMTDPGLRTALEMAVREVVYNPTERPLTSGELLPLVKDCDGYIAGLDYIDHSVIEAAGSLKVIARYGVGVDRVDVASATQKGIVVANTPGANSAAVAELAIGLMLALGRRSAPLIGRHGAASGPGSRASGCGAKRSAWWVLAPSVGRWPPG